jgi:hypothetical protein
MSDRKPGRHRKTAWAQNPDNACAENGVTADGRSYRYSAAHNGYVLDEEPQAVNDPAPYEEDEHEFGHDKRIPGNTPKDVDMSQPHAVE